jgi:hypothetical protein
MIFTRLSLTEDIHQKLYRDAQRARDTLRWKALDLTALSRTDPSVRPPYKWDQISETAKHGEILTTIHNDTPITKHYYNVGRYRAGMNEENWLARWYLWHSFPRQESQYRQNEIAQQDEELSLPGNAQRWVISQTSLFGLSFFLTGIIAPAGRTQKYSPRLVGSDWNPMCLAHDPMIPSRI